MKRFLFPLLFLVANYGFAHDYDVDFDQVTWTKNGSKISQSGNEITIEESNAPYEAQTVSLTLNVDPNMDDLYFMASLYFEDIA